jgi:lariat debranching enzyme
MPAKYREMADFHEYYSGARVAPVLTIFIGGNHEASNHLFELFYGGWVAPNIYYMGAANVLQIGNLRVAGMSGIWKGYDFRRPHYERLPYNEKDMYGIYHVRELDVRKLLAIRSQVDIGMSHDWPQTIEWSGNWRWLFKKKDRFQYDAENAKLGNTAAKMVLDRLRPKHWFSAHLHIRYEATYDHNDPEGIRTKDGKLIPQGRHKEQLSGWHDFQESSKVADAEEHEQYMAEQQERREKRKENGGGAGPSYTFNETFKQVTVNDDLNRKVDVVDKPMPTTEGIPQLDGGCVSRPAKRPREPSGSPEQPPPGLRSPRFEALNARWPRDMALGDSTQEQLPMQPQKAPVAKNPDELDLDLSDDDSTGKLLKAAPIAMSKNPDEIDLDMSDEDDTIVKPPPRSGSPFPTLGMQSQSRKSDLSEDGGAPIIGSTGPSNSVTRKSSADSTRSSLDASAKEFVPQKQNGHTSPRPSTEPALRPEAAEFVLTDMTNANTADEDAVLIDAPAVPDDIQAELESTSKIFQKPVQVDKSPDLPFPEEISNKTTRFLALDKCLPGRHFLELLEVEPLAAAGNTEDSSAIERPVKLQYDPEWLAILRVFAPELQLGGNREDPVPYHRGDTYYDQRILEERKWVFEHIVSEGKLEVPEDFEVTAPVYDAGVQVEEGEMPREVTNPQTSAFCKLIGIDNPFDISEEERDARMLAGPKPSEDRGGWGGRGRGRGRGRGGHGGRGRGGGFGRGQGRGGSRGGRGHHLNH